MDMPLVLWRGLGRPSNAESWARQKAEDEQLKQIDCAARQLPPLMWEAVALKFYHNLKLKEIAEIQNCPVGTVKSRLHYALKRMGDMVSQ